VAARSLDLVVAALLPAPNDATSGRLARVATFSPRPRSSPPRGGGHCASGLPCASRRDAGPAPSRRLLALFPAPGATALPVPALDRVVPAPGAIAPPSPPLAMGGCCRLVSPSGAAAASSSAVRPLACAPAAGRGLDARGGGQRMGGLGFHTFTGSSIG
jgi:hypothetical protein